MFTQVSVEFEHPKERAQSNWAYALYGALMDEIDASFADELHSMKRTPISQYLFVDSSKMTWHITMFGAAADHLMPILKAKDKYFLTKTNCTLAVKEVRDDISYSENGFCELYLVKKLPLKSININIQSPCAFKSDGEYVNIPSTHLLLQSSINSWNAFAEKNTIRDDEALAQMLSHMRISRYNLRSTSYELKGINIPAFVGSLTISLSGAEPLMRLVNLLLHFGAYSGVGIKTALGMGGYEVV